MMKRATWTLLWLLCAVVALEFATRLDDWARFGVSFASPAVALDDLITRDSLGMHGRASVQYRQFRMNALGLRGPEIDLSSQASRALVVTAGASETFGLYESKDHEWPRQLQDTLAESCGSAVVVGNAAFAGMSLPTVIGDVAGRIARLRPRVVVYYPTPMQYLEAELPKAATPTVSEEALPHTRLRAAGRFREAVKRSIPTPILDFLRKRDISKSRRVVGTSAQEHAATLRLDAFESDLRRLISTVRAIGAVPILVVHQNRFAFPRDPARNVMLTAWERFYPRYTGKAILEFDSLAADRTRQVGATEAVAVVDPAQKLLGAPVVPFADFSHFTDLGSSVVAGEVGRAARLFACSDVAPERRASLDDETQKVYSANRGVSLRSY